MFEFIKFIPLPKIMDSNEDSFDLYSDNKLDKEKNNNLFLRKKKFNFLSEEEKSILSEEEEKKKFRDNSLLTCENSPINSNNIELYEISENIPNNQIESRRNRGRQRLKNFDKAVHGSNDFDNVQRKIKVHFLTFLINFCNDALVTEYGSSPFTFKQKNLLF